MFVYFFRESTNFNFWPKKRFSIGISLKKQENYWKSYEYKIDEDDFKGNKEDYEGREQWDERAKIEELIDSNYGYIIINYKKYDWIKLSNIWKLIFRYFHF